MKNKTTSRLKKAIAKTAAGKKTVRLSHSHHGISPVQIEKIHMVKSEDHKVKVLVLTGKQHVWFERSGSLENFLTLLDDKKFERVSKFYILNWQLTLGFNQKTQIISFTTGFSCYLEHPIKPSVFKERFL
jgi:DNA-binding LytR/AlgR family response regulator